MGTKPTTDMTGRMAIEMISPLGFDETLDACREAVIAEGFGVLTEIDMAATLTAKLGGDHDPYVILGACHPSSAQQLLEVVPAMGVLLPCNVTVASEPDGVKVRAMDPSAIVAAVMQSPSPGDLDAVATVETIADDISGRLRLALARL
jgi:uncharacterized protein (DUF302 family)